MEVELTSAMPRDIHAEHTLLSTLLVFPEYVDKVTDSVDEADFPGRGERLLYKTIKELGSTHERADVSAVRAAFKKNDPQDTTNSAFLINEVLDASPNIFDLELYKTKVKDATRARTIARILVGALQQVGKEDSGDVATEAANQLLSITEKIDDDVKPVTLTDVTNTVYAELQERRITKNYMTGVPTGSNELDSYMLGWQRGVLTILAAYTSVGKTAAGLDFALKTLEEAGNERVHVGYVSLEMTKRMLGFRMLANAAGEPLYFVRTGHLSDLGMSKVEAGVDRLQAVGERFHVTDGAFSVDHICATARALHRAGKLDVLFVDYLQLVDGKESDNREREVNKIGLELLRLAKKLDIAVVAFAQLNEGIVNREGHEPILSDVRESRAINQHARTVLLLSRPWVFEQQSTVLKPCESKMFVRKNSESKQGSFSMHFNGAYQRFEDGECHAGCEYYEAGGDGNWLNN